MHGSAAQRCLAARAATGNPGLTIKHAEVLHVLAQPDATSVGTHELPALLGHEHHRQCLVGAGKAAGINLDDIDGVCLEELLEYDARLRVLACCDAHMERRQCSSDGCVAQHIVGRRGLLDEPRLVLGQLGNVVDCLWNVKDCDVAEEKME